MKEEWSDQEIEEIFDQLFEKIIILSENMIYHCDIKEGNIIIDSNGKI